MADDGVYCKFANITARAGANCSTTSNVVTWTDGIVLDGENFINAYTRFDWSAVYATLSVKTRGILMDATSAYLAMFVINYDLSGIGSREAETRLDFLRDLVERDLRILVDIKNQDFINGV